MEGNRRKIEIVRVPSNERGNFRSVDGVRNSYNYIRVGTYCPEPEVKVVVCDSKPPIEQNRKFKKHLGPVSKLLRRRHHTAYLATKSCDNIYSVNRSTSSLDWRVHQTTNEQGFQSRQSSSLDWRVGRSINKLHWRDTTRSAEQLSRSGAISSDHLQTPSTKSKLISLLRRLSPRLSRPGSKNSLQASPTICPWVQVEYSSESIDDGLREDSQECDVSFQRELQLNELRKRMAGIPTTSQVTTKVTKEQQGSTQIRIHVQQPENDCTNASKS
ncbi:hypothetical protein K0M31_009659 [Melipona bicolor]|uniref:Uncharacterized protein n=1 Tax=Melipona bicolor TaxID=60889 RepID=A0AA40FNI6_9HYME|nr:hypothetical protein K0M31_009659 [Melipona bicolor]